MMRNALLMDRRLFLRIIAFLIMMAVLGYVLGIICLDIHHCRKLLWLLSPSRVVLVVIICWQVFSGRAQIMDNPDQTAAAPQELGQQAAAAAAQEAGQQAAAAQEPDPAPTPAQPAVHVPSNLPVDATATTRIRPPSEPSRRPTLQEVFGASASCAQQAEGAGGKMKEESLGRQEGKSIDSIPRTRSVEDVEDASSDVEGNASAGSAKSGSDDSAEDSADATSGHAQSDERGDSDVMTPGTKSTTEAEDSAAVTGAPTDSAERGDNDDMVSASETNQTEEAEDSVAVRGGPSE